MLQATGSFYLKGKTNSINPVISKYIMPKCSHCYFLYYQVIVVCVCVFQLSLLILFQNLHNSMEFMTILQNTLKRKRLYQNSEKIKNNSSDVQNIEFVCSVICCVYVYKHNRYNKF